MPQLTEALIQEVQPTRKGASQPLPQDFNLPCLSLAYGVDKGRQDGEKYESIYKGFSMKCVQM